MKIIIKESLQRDLKKIKNKKTLQKVLHLIEASQFFDETEFGILYDIKKLKNTKKYYRIRFGDYRLGLKLNNQELILIRIKHRKDIYKIFP